MFLAMQVLEIPAGGRGFPLVDNNCTCSLQAKIFEDFCSNIMI